MGTIINGTWLVTQAAALTIGLVLLLRYIIKKYRKNGPIVTASGKITLIPLAAAILCAYLFAVLDMVSDFADRSFVPAFILILAVSFAAGIWLSIIFVCAHKNYDGTDYKIKNTLESSLIYSGLYLFAMLSLTLPKLNLGQTLAGLTIVLVPLLFLSIYFVWKIFDIVKEYRSDFYRRAFGKRDIVFTVGWLLSWVTGLILLVIAERTDNSYIFLAFAGAIILGWIFSLLKLLNARRIKAKNTDIMIQDICRTAALRFKLVSFASAFFLLMIRHV